MASARESIGITELILEGSVTVMVITNALSAAEAPHHATVIYTNTYTAEHWHAPLNKFARTFSCKSP